MGAGGHAREARARARRGPRAGRANAQAGTLLATDRAELPALETDRALPAPTRPARVLEPAPDAELLPVGPGSFPDDVIPRWLRRRREPIVVRMANRLTEGSLFGLILATLVGLGVLAGAWALASGFTLGGQVPPAASSVVVPSPSAASTSFASPSPVATPSAVAPQRRYFVRRGDTLAAIAGRIYGDESLWPLILAANRAVIRDPQNLAVGSSLWIPDRPSP